jgi:hypothetical protein
LLGAGASYDADIPISSAMINNVEELIEANEDWKTYKDLYYCLKSSIQYRFGIIGDSSPDLINIETLIDTMDELLKSYQHPLYPFVGSWTPRLSELAGPKFTNIKNLKNNIVRELSTNWMHLEHIEKASYYKKLVDFQKKYNHPLNIFSLNYDLCIEKQCSDCGINRGFSDHIWNWKNLAFGDSKDYGIYLYKIHGSIDWANKLDGSCEYKDSVVPPEQLAIIFGTSYKLQYLDPFLYLVYEFRRRTLENETKIIICIGYSFNDEHINGILGQSLKADPERIIVAVFPIIEPSTIGDMQKYIGNKLKTQNLENIHIINKSAKDYLENELSIESIEKHLKMDIMPF